MAESLRCHWGWNSFKTERLPGQRSTATKSPSGPKANDKTLYNLGWLTKPITAELSLRLAWQGKLSLDEPVLRYWTDPDVKVNPWNELLTPELCLSHLTGFTNWRYQTHNVLTFQWQPGIQTGYSAEGYDYVARFAEKNPGTLSEPPQSRRGGNFDIILKGMSEGRSVLCRYFVQARSCL